MAASEEIEIRPMTKAEVDIAVHWADREGWKSGLSDGECYYEVDPRAFSAVLLDGRLIGSFSVMVYSKRFAFRGFYILSPEYRGRGIGLAIQEHVDRLVEPYNFGIDGVFAMQDRYAAYGFRFSHGNIRYEGIGGGARPRGLVDAGTVPFDALARYDARHFPAERPVFIRRWPAQPDATALAVLDGGTIHGYGAGAAVPKRREDRSALYRHARDRRADLSGARRRGAGAAALHRRAGAEQGRYHARRTARHGPGLRHGEDVHEGDPRPPAGCVLRRHGFRDRIISWYGAAAPHPS
jgi:GNAT superfamily N-acetyltransferase